MRSGALKYRYLSFLPTPPVLMVALACVAVVGLADGVGDEGQDGGQPVVVAAAVSTAVPAAAATVGPNLPFNPLSEASFETDASADFGHLLDAATEPHTVPHMGEVSHRFRSGETMSQVLDRAGIGPVEVDRWMRAARKVYNLNHVYAGQEMIMLIEKPRRELVRLEMEIGPRTVFVAERGDDGITARRETVSYERRLRVVGGEITHSLYMTAAGKDVPDKIISEVAEILGWEINFARDLRPGATFRLVYEELVHPRNQDSVAGRVLAVEVSNRGRVHEGFRFEHASSGSFGYYNREGDGLGRDFLRYPVAFSRVSSQFSRGRYHPVLKRRVPHYGVDFAAPPGTPIRAVADGKVTKAGWYGGNGRFVKLRHSATYETGYAHLSRIGVGVRAGTSVKKGQVIGYVGSTGLATGPHLHFALYKGGKYVDPLRADLPRARSVSGQALAEFQLAVGRMDAAYAKAGHGKPARLAAAAD
ncbi:MAG: peptidoglycan DD-metalloendopeptidase family protein [Deltaproteobacteria bacterium]